VCFFAIALKVGVGKAFGWLFKSWFLVGCMSGLGATVGLLTGFGFFNGSAVGLLIGEILALNNAKKKIDNNK
jgi:hypothetical protein